MTHYRVVFKGEIEEGRELSRVKSDLSALFKAPPEKIDRLFATKCAVIASGIDQNRAIEYQSEMKKIGALAAIEDMPDAGAPARSAAPPEKKTEESATPPPAAPKPAAAVRSAGGLHSGTDKSGMQESIRRIREAFAGPIPPVKIGIGYRIGIVFVAIGMALLPVIYVCLIGGVAYLTYYHATENLAYIQALHSSRATVVLYIAPILGGITIVLFMIKPIFIRQSMPKTALPLSKHRDPLLFAFIDQISKIVGAPLPSSVEADVMVNASAGFRQGLFSFFSRDLVLTIGLPLAAGLSMRQFAGVLAHELGHFSQGTGMRFTYVIRSINYWFMRVVYERDVLDEKLAKWSHEANDVYITFPLLVARFCVWLSRRVLWVFMMLGHAISGFLSRQMELDADRYEGRIAGTEAFEATSFQLPILAVSSEGIFESLNEDYDHSRLPENLIASVLDSHAGLDEHKKASIKQKALFGKTRFWDTHPTERERIANIRRESPKGIFSLDEPATALFTNFEELAKNTTLRFYRGLYGPYVPKAMLVPRTQQTSEMRDETGF
jgi:Zn-dependent protease with chaperone function